MTSYGSLKTLLEQHHHIGVISHMRPDGDAIGSTLALGLALQGMGKSVTMWNADPMPERYAFLEGAELLQALPEEVPAELEVLICVDSGNWSRIGDRAKSLFAGFPLVVNIDHHGSNDNYGQVNIVEAKAAACGMVLYNMLQSWNCPITKAIANALYVAISTDTGSFQYSSTTSSVLRVAADLVEVGVDVGEINRLVYQEVPYSSLKVNGEVLQQMVVEHDGSLSHYSMTMARKQEMGLSLEDTKDLVDIIRVVKGVRVAIIFEELEDGVVRMSLRSKDPAVNVSDIAAQFGGGGHAMAAGIRARGELTEIRAKVLEAIRAALKG